jgi:hypothetical protein
MAAAMAAAQAEAALTVEEANIMWILEYTGFNDLTHQEAIRDDTLPSYNDALTLTKKDVSNLAKDLTGRTIAQGRIQFGLR